MRELYDALPTLRPVIDDHEAFFEEILSHVVFGDITRWAQVHVNDPSAEGDLVRLLALLEVGLAERGTMVENLVTVSFLENLDHDSKVIPLLGPALIETLDDLGGSPPRPRPALQPSAREGSAPP